MRKRRSQTSGFLERNSCDHWALAHRVIYGRPFSIAPPLRPIYESQEQRVVIQKAAQVFVSEYMTNVALWFADTGQAGRGHSLYVFPAREQGDNFSQARIDGAVDESPYLTSRKAQPYSVRLKHIGKGYLYVRGAQTRRDMISVDADCVLFDEVAEYPTGVISTMQKRLGSSRLGWMRAGSTPRYPADEMGELWEQSTQAAYHVRCSHCSAIQPLTIEENFDAETARVVCRHCRGDMTLDRLAEGEWVAAHPGREWTGYQLNKLLSPLADLQALAATYRKVLDGRATTNEVQEFYNSDAGLPYLPKGGNLNADLLDACRQVDPAYYCPQATPGQNALMGVDVGSRLHVVVYVREPERPDALRLIYADSVRDWEGPGGIDGLMARYDVGRCVVDANPDTRKARELQRRWPGRVWLAYYPNWVDEQHSEVCVWKRDEGVVHINRTAILDAVLARVQQRRLILPANARALGGALSTQTNLGEYYRHMGSPVRVIEQDKRGNTVARYAQNGADHFAHASAYAETASQGHEAGVLVPTTSAPKPADRARPRHSRRDESDPFSVLRPG